MTARLMLSCGETSGDLYAGALVRELRALDPTVSVRGVGGPQFAAAGGELIADYRGLSVTGFAAPLGKLGHTYARLRTLLDSARRDPPDAIIAIDVPDFNFWLVRGAKRLGIPIVFYISPQIWAWRGGRLKTIKATADLVIVIFPFEEKIYSDAGVPVRFVGHPLIDLVAHADKPAFLRRHGLSADAPTVAILPGSRANELARILPDLIGAAERIRARVPNAQFIVARAPDLDDALFDAARSPVLGPVAVVEGDTDAVLSSADVVLTASGTATVQTAIHDVPMVIVYRLSALEYWIGRRLVTVDTFGMVNLIAGEKIVPELIQEAFTPEAVADEAISLLTDSSRRARVREGLARVRQRLGDPGASRRAAEAILQVVRQGGRPK
ncbi:MAG: lipid-A-disaccharide synthase [Acidobacteriota bacterium]